MITDWLKKKHNATLNVTVYLSQLDNNKINMESEQKEYFESI